MSALGTPPKAVASMCKELTELDVRFNSNITDAAVLAVAAGCKQLTEFDLSICCSVNTAVAQASFPNT
eukprot:2169718-Prymnesium_polylepis.1